MADSKANGKLRLIEAASTQPESRAETRGALATARLRREVFELVCRQMHTLAGRAPDFDDLVQMAAEQVFRSLPSFEGRSAPATWTYRICYHTVLKQRRWYKRWLRRFVYAEDPGVAEAVARVSGFEPELVERRERARRLRAALEQVPAKRRVVVMLHDLDQLEIDEIAAIVGANPLTVRSRLRDGRRLLARVLESDPYFGSEACSLETRP
jgi:RNA polymerase sigma-70 factor (ECF subfamily)